ncbi:MAG: hypothetical protein ACOX4F_01900 [Atopobiaceae bacterium]
MHDIYAPPLQKHKFLQKTVSFVLTAALSLGGMVAPISTAYAADTDDVSTHSQAPYPNYDASDGFISRNDIASTYHVNAPLAERLNVLNELQNGKVPRGNAVFAHDDEQARAKGFDVRGTVDNIDTKPNTGGDLRKLILKLNDGSTKTFYVRHTEIVPAGDQPSVAGVSRYVEDKNLSFVAPYEGDFTKAPGSFVSIGGTNLNPTYRFDPESAKGASLNTQYMDGTGTATVFIMPAEKENSDGTRTRQWYWCANPVSAVPNTYDYYVELPFELSPQTQYDSGVEVMYLMNTVLQNAGLNDENSEANNDNVYKNRIGLPNFKVAYQALYDEYNKVLQSRGSNEPSALDSNVTYGELYDKLNTLINGGTIAKGTIYEQDVTLQSDGGRTVPNLENTDYWEAAHVGVLGIEYAFLSYIQGWPMDGMDVFQAGTARMGTGFTENDTRTNGARAMARLLVAHAEAARDKGLLTNQTANATFDLTTTDVTRDNGTTTVTVKPDTSNGSSISVKVPKSVTVKSMTKNGSNVLGSASTDTSTEDGSTTYTFSSVTSFPDTIVLTTSQDNENALRDDVLFTKVGTSKTVAKAFADVNDLYKDETTGHWVLREFVGAPDSRFSSSTDAKTTGQEWSQTVFKLTPEY